MPSSILDFIRDICCCKGNSDEDDNERLLGAHNNDYDVDHGRSTASNRNLNNGVGTFGIVGTSRISDTPAQPRAKTQEEIEEDKVTRIIDRTQQSIIDVSNLDNSALDIDVAKRARLYSEAVKRHDSYVEKKRISFNSAKDETSIKLRIIIDPISTPFEVLSRPMQEKISAEDLDILNKTADFFLSAYEIGAQIECKEELIAYMSLDD